MHALHLSSGQLWKTGLLALSVTLVLLALFALAAPPILEPSRSAPTVTTAGTASGEPAPPPVWKTDPLAPPPLLTSR